MDARRQNQQGEQLLLPFAPGGQGEAPTAAGGRVEASISWCEREASDGVPAPSPTSETSVMQEVLKPENLYLALHAVRSNKGSAGVDGMTVEELPEHLKLHWPEIKRRLVTGTYKPQPVKRVEIPKPGQCKGGQCKGGQ